MTSPQHLAKENFQGKSEQFLDGHFLNKHQESSPISVVDVEFETRLSRDYLEHAVALLREHLQFCEDHPVAAAIRGNSDRRTQHFFYEADPLRPSDSESVSVKPVSFSPSLPGLVLSVRTLARILEWHYPNEESFRSSKLESNLRLYFANRLEFALHEYGHLVATNGGVVCNPDKKQELKSKRGELCSLLRRMPSAYSPDRAESLIPEILSDIRAEVVRRDIVLPPESPRKIDAFPLIGVFERATRGGATVSPTFSLFGLFRMGAWVPICLANGRQDLANHARKEIFHTCMEAQAPQLLPVVGAAIQFFNLYMESHRFEEESFLQRMEAGIKGV